MLKPIVTVLLSACLASPALVSTALAQTATDDWDLGRDAERGLVIAAVTFDNFGIAVRCRENILSVVASGLPVGNGVRTFKYSMGGEPERDTPWVGARSSQAAFAVWPAAIATDLSHGGRFSIGVPDNGRVRRIAVDLPASPSAIGEVFKACGRELATGENDEPDGPSMGSLRWKHVPAPSFPSRTDSDAGIAALICAVNARGGLRGCEVQSEFPEGGGFGRAATLGAHQTGRVEIPAGEVGALEGRKISFVVRYNISDDPTPTIPSRLPPRTPG